MICFRLLGAFYTWRTRASAPIPQILCGAARTTRDASFKLAPVKNRSYRDDALCVCMCCPVSLCLSRSVSVVRTAGREARGVVVQVMYTTSPPDPEGRRDSCRTPCTQAGRPVLTVYSIWAKVGYYECVFIGICPSRPVPGWTRTSTYALALYLSTLRE